MRVKKNIINLIGNTPMIKLDNYTRNRNLNIELFAKLESYNPTGSTKDRIVFDMIRDAEARGCLNKNSTIIEPTSGNTGISLAAIGSILGYKVIIVMPDSMSLERRKLISAYGARLILTDKKLGMNGSIEKAKELLNEIPNSFMLDQFNNLINSKSHFNTTGPEIFESMDGNIDTFICGVGTGGTITGIGEYLKLNNKKVKIIAVEPILSPVLSGGNAGFHRIEGIGAGFIPSVLNVKIYDRIVKVKDEDALKGMKDLINEEKILVGISSGAVVSSLEYMIKEKTIHKEERIVLLFSDHTNRYLTLL